MHIHTFFLKKKIRDNFTEQRVRLLNPKIYWHITCWTLYQLGHLQLSQSWLNSWVSLVITKFNLLFYGPLASCSFSCHESCPVTTNWPCICNYHGFKEVSFADILKSIEYVKGTLEPCLLEGCKLEVPPPPHWLKQDPISLGFDLIILATSNLVNQNSSSTQPT